MNHISLNGNWKMRAIGESEWHDAIVPGTVYTDLLRDGLIEDPFWRENELKTFPLMEKDYEYVREFKLTQDDLKCDQFILHCDGLDTLAHVFINGNIVGDADNMHRTWEWDIGPLLKNGQNLIRVLFDSPLRFVEQANQKCPCWQATDGTPGFPHIRKAHYQFGWDWGPRLPDAGIWRNIEILAIKGGRLINLEILQEHWKGGVTLHVTPEVNLIGESSCIRINVVSPDGIVYSANSENRFQIVNPKLWWPAGYGDQPLYTVTAELEVDGKKIDQMTKRIGLRTVTVSREKQDDGEEFCHVVNGLKIFAMGGDYIPEDNLLGRMTRERTRILLEDAKMAHFNTIRVWGGGVYPSDYFYDICDELGLLVWQDMMFACAYYNLTKDFDASIRAEAEENIKRIRHHACLALICGNNEMEEFHESSVKDPDWGYRSPRNPAFHADYIKMFEYILPGVVQQYAPQTFYWPSSPSSGGSFDNAQNPTRGDVHYWDVWHGEKPFTSYRSQHFRYVSEFGFQSFPNLYTVQSFTLPKDRNIFSRIMERHQRNKSANGKILNYISQTYQYPKDFDHLLYCSQILQADAIRCGVEHWRRERGYCMGTIIWQLNDCWPVASWASIDYFGRWKALHYAAKRFFAPVLLSVEENGEIDQNPHINEFHPEPILCSVHPCLTNETGEQAGGTFFWSLRHADGTVVREGQVEAIVGAYSSVWLDEINFPDASVTMDCFAYSFVMQNNVISNGIALFCAPKHFEFCNPHLSATIEGNEIIVRSLGVAKMVEIRSDDPDMLLSDNYFDMVPGEQRVSIIRGSASNIRLRSVYDIAE